MAETVLVDVAALREQVRSKYRQVALEPTAGFHFHTGRPLAHRLGYDPRVVDALPEEAVASFAGVANPFALRRPRPGERVVDVGAGAGLDAFIAAAQVGAQGRVVGVDMTPEMLQRSRATAALLGLEQVEFRQGLAEALPVADQWADTVIANGVINLCADKRAVFAEIWRVLPRAAGCSSPTSPTAAPCPRRRCGTSTCGLGESPAGYPVRAGGDCSRSAASCRCGSDPRWTPSAAPWARPTRAGSTSTATHSWRASPTDTRRSRWRVKQPSA